ncbi:CopG family antitoxin, partial [Anaplasma marginale]|uniref:CopG family antitoxin n=1 Tax=Anaplasma marginale TaxID=770 RepID=UPI0009B64526
MNDSKKPWPSLPNDKAAEDFVERSDLSEFDWSLAEPAPYEFEEKSARVTLRMPESQLAQIKA